jgi:hypothetical protein
MSTSESRAFDKTVRKVLSVSREELKRREEEWKRKREGQKPRGRRPKISAVSPEKSGGGKNEPR